MGKETGIKWTDSTYNSFWGCTKVGPACDHCYAEGVDKRTGENHWGHGVPRRRLSEHARNEPFRWNKQADKFEAEHGRRRRVFTLSMGDLFDNEVPEEWRREHMATMQACDRLEWQICTKRISNLPKMVPWRGELSASLFDTEEAYLSAIAKPLWPQHIGVLVTIVTQEEANRDIPRLLKAKNQFGIPWVGISYEPAQEEIDWHYPVGLWPDGPPMCCSGRECGCMGKPTDPPLIWGLDWIIFGGKSGGQWNDRPFSFDWARSTRNACAEFNVAFFMKQAAAFRPTDDMIPPDLMIRQWPKGH